MDTPTHADAVPIPTLLMSSLTASDQGGDGRNTF